MKNKINKIILCLILILIIIGTLFINKIKFKCNIEGNSNINDICNGDDGILSNPKYSFKTKICSILENAGEFNINKNPADLRFEDIEINNESDYTLYKMNVYDNMPLSKNGNKKITNIPGFILNNSAIALLHGDDGHGDDGHGDGCDTKDSLTTESHPCNEYNTKCQYEISISDTKTKGIDQLGDRNKLTITYDKNPIKVYVFYPDLRNKLEKLRGDDADCNEINNKYDKYVKKNSNYIKKNCRSMNCQTGWTPTLDNCCKDIFINNNYNSFIDAHRNKVIYYVQNSEIFTIWDNNETWKEIAEKHNLKIGNDKTLGYEIDIHPETQTQTKIPFVKGAVMFIVITQQS